MAGVLLEDVTKVFPGNVVAVKEAHIDIADKEFLVLVGPSGCGKSTTLRMIAGLEEITSGTIKIGDRVVNDVPPKDRDIAMVFQNYALYPHMTVRNNMAFGLKLRRFPKSEIEERVQEAARILGIGELLDRKPKALSGGQRQRVAVGRAIVRQPAVFLFDEPLSNLDAKLRVEMRAELSRLHQRLSTTMIYVTHDQIEAMTLGHRIVVMNAALIQQVDEPLKVYDYPINRFVAGFIGTPAMNFLEGKLVRTNGRIAFDEGTSIVDLPDALCADLSSQEGKEATLGVRPENVLSSRIEVPEGMRNVLKAEVRVIEPLGDEMILYLATQKHEFIAKVDAHFRTTVGDVLDTALDMEKLHVFDKATGENLTVKTVAQVA